MASSEGATDVSTEECFERKKAELIELIEKLAKRLSLDEGHDATTTPIDGRDLGAGSTSRARDPYIGLLEDELPELIRQYEMLAAQLGSDDGHGAATNTVNGRGLGAGSTLRHEDPYIARLEAERDELRRERGLGAGKLGPDDGQRAATTTTNGRDLGAGSIAEAPKIMVTAPHDGHEVVANTTNVRSLGAGSIFTVVPDDGHGVVANTINGRRFGPGSILRRCDLGAGSTFTVVPDDGHGVVANTIKGRNLEARGAFLDHVAQLLQHIDVNAEPDNNNHFTHSNTMLAVYTGVAWSILILGLCFQSGGS